MSITNFNRADLALTATPTLVYGPVPVGTVAVVFSGSISNIDTTNKLLHTGTLDIHSGASILNQFKDVAIPYGSALTQMPKVVLKAGESIFASADAAAVVQLSIQLLEVVG